MDIDFQPLVDAVVAGDWVAVGVLVGLALIVLLLRALSGRWPVLGRVADALKRLKLGKVSSEPAVAPAPEPVKPEDKDAGIAGVK